MFSERPPQVIVSVGLQIFFEATCDILWSIYDILWRSTGDILWSYMWYSLRAYKWYYLRLQVIFSGVMCDIQWSTGDILWGYMWYSVKVYRWYYLRLMVIFSQTTTGEFLISTLVIGESHTTATYYHDHSFNAVSDLQECLSIAVLLSILYQQWYICYNKLYNFFSGKEKKDSRK